MFAMLTLKGHSGQVMALAFSPDGRWLASAGWDGTVRLWERPSYRQVRCMRTPYDHALTVAFSPDGIHLAMSFRNRDALPDARGFGSLAWTPIIPASRQHPDLLPVQDTWLVSQGASMVVVHPQRDTLTTYGDSSGIRVWDPMTRSPLPIAPEIPTSWKVSDLAYSPDGSKLFAIAHRNSEVGELFAWRADSTKPTEFPITNDLGTCLAVSPDDFQVCVGFISGSVVWWDLDRPRNVSAVESPIIDLSFSPDGRSLLLACEDGLIRLWDVAGRRVQTTFDWVIGSLGCVAFAPDGLTAAAGGDGVILVWDVD